ncbi:MAG: hypothetical protein M0Z69_04015 [Actinomycetota bacterium]|nr:hypothetical protein [Actinomycetota bacterium]
MPTVAWLIARHPLLGGEFLRATMPARLCRDYLGWATAVADRMGDTDPGGPLHFLTPGDSPVIVRPDVIVVRPIREWRPEYTAQARRAGQTVIADLDDDVWAHEDWTPDSRPNDDRYDDWIWDCDGYLVSTPAIARRVRHGVRGRRPRGPVVVAPNVFDVGALGQFGPPRSGTGRIGTRMWLSGRQSGDIRLYQGLIEPLLDTLDLTFVHVGAEDGHRFSDHGFPPERLEEHQSVAEPLLGEALHTCSVGVICADDVEYNRAKTLTHVIELASIGLPLVIASDLAIYRHVPGRVEPRLGEVRRRLKTLDNPDTWRLEAAEVQRFARAVVRRDTTAYVLAIQRLSANLLRV